MTGKSAQRQLYASVCSAIAVLALLVAPCVRAQQGNLNQELQLFNNLSPQQQQAILQQLGIGGGGAAGGLGGLGALGALLGGSSGNGSNLGSGQQAALLQQQLQQQQQRRQSQTATDEETTPYLKPGDTVLVDIKLPPQPADTQNGQNSNQPNNAQAAPGVGANLNGLPLSASQLSQLGLRNAPPSQPATAPSPPVEEVSILQRKRLQDLIDTIRAHNPYRLDSNGALLLPGIPPVPLAGLSDDLASRRVAAEPAFQYLQISLIRLPLRKTGEEALKPFGYDLFDNSINSFLPALNTPVPADYVVGPGDVLLVQLYGTRSEFLNLAVSRDGYLNFPQIGPIEVGGRRYSEVKADVENRVARQMIGEHANVSMGETRTITVFVLGDAKYPGSYTLSGLATVTTALFAAGGVQKTGSLRKIEVKRQGETVRTLDLYDLLMGGNSAGDIKLQPGDVVLVPPVGATASLDGEVLRPAIYELKGEQTVADLVKMGGGLTPFANRESASLVRIDAKQQRIVLDVDPSDPQAATLTLRNGDALRITRLQPRLDSGVTLQGYVYQPRYFAWHPGLRLSEIIPTVDALKPDADQRYLLIRRELPPDRHIAVLSADLDAALAAPGSAGDVLLMPRDTVTAFDLETSRQYVIEPLLEELRVQENLAQPTEIVHIDGRVKVPGDYPLELGMRVSDLVRAGGGLESSAYSGRAELSRYTVESNGQRRTEVMAIDLNAVSRGDPAANLVLRPFDHLSVKEVSGWTEQAQVNLAGEVRFPGTYIIKRGETLRSVIERAGGLTDLAFPQGAVFTRMELKRQEQEQLDRLAERMKTDIAEMALMGTRAGLAGSEAAISIGSSLLSQLQAAKAVGRLVINLEAAIHARPGSSDDIVLRDGDQLVVPKQRQEVMVLGEVQDATSHLYHPGLTRDDYINESGGMTRQADKGHIYVVRADGSVVTGNSGWFRSGESVRIRAGDAIVVPLDTVKLPALTLWQQSTAILYNLAIAVAAVHAL